MAPPKRSAMSRFFTWTRQTLDMLCDRPDHLQRLAIIGAGISIYPAVAVLVWIVWRGYERTAELQSQSLAIMGVALYAMLALLGLVIVALLGTVKGLRIGPRGLELTTIADDPDVDPSTTRDTRLGGGDDDGGFRRRGRFPWEYGGEDRDYVAPTDGDATGGKQDMQVTE